jgi:hypothetical protein
MAVVAVRAATSASPRRAPGLTTREGRQLPHTSPTQLFVNGLPLLLANVLLQRGNGLG